MSSHQRWDRSLTSVDEQSSRYCNGLSLTIVFRVIHKYMFIDKDIQQNRLVNDLTGTSGTECDYKVDLVDDRRKWWHWNEGIIVVADAVGVDSGKVIL